MTDRKIIIKEQFEALFYSNAPYEVPEWDDLPDAPRISCEGCNHIGDRAGVCFDCCPYCYNCYEPKQEAKQ